jgi:hypothetical protein
MKITKQFRTQSLLLFLLLFAACSKQSPCSDYTSKTFNYLLPDSTKSQIPYIGNETLTFISNQGDTAILVGQGKNNYILKEKVKVSSNPECPQEDNYSYEHIDIEYQGNNFNLFNVIYSMYIDKYNSIYINVNINDKANYFADIGVYNDISRYNSPINVGSNIINGYNFNREDGKPAFIYNKNVGILSIIIDSSLTYTLIK